MYGSTVLSIMIIWACINFMYVKGLECYVY